MKVANQLSISFLMFAVILSGCGGGGSSSQTDGSGGSGGGGSSNTPPTISGSPPTSVKVGDSYAFTPQASDANGDALTFSIENKPVWADFDSSTGNVSGVPSMGDIGSYSDIRVSVSDGQASASMPDFTIDVTQIALGSASLSWTAPTQNDDGSTLTDLAGFRIYYGTASGDYSNEILIDNPSITNYLVESLSPDTYFFAAKAFNSSGLESDYSAEAIKTIN